MKRILWLLSVSLVCSLGSFAQQNVETPGNSNDSKSVSSLQGIYIGGGLSHGTDGGDGFLSIGFINELRMCRNISLILGGNVLNSTYQQLNVINNQVVITTTYGVQLSLSAEARIYLDFEKSNLNGTINKLNSGWFIGLPVEITSSYLNSNQPFSAGGIAPSLGYRYALSDKMFLEAAGGLGLTLRSFRTFDAVPYLRLKACYTFQ